MTTVHGAGGRGRREQAYAIRSYERESSPFVDDAQYLQNQPKIKPSTITLDYIFQLHKAVLGNHVAAGRLRTCDLIVGEGEDAFVPMDWEAVPRAMEDFVRWLFIEVELSEMAAGELAARAHHQLAFIHPFEDGNGRTSRLLMNIILTRSGFRPVIVPEELRNDYYAALKEATNTGNYEQFVWLICFLQQCAMDDINDE